MWELYQSDFFGGSFGNERGLLGCGTAVENDRRFKGSIRMQNEQHMGSRWLELPLALAGFFLNFFWEMVQSPFYDDIYRKTYVEILVSRLHCTLGDVLILLSAYWIVAWLTRNRYWVMALHIRNVLLFTFLGLGYTIVSEWVNVDIRSAWNYGATMPRVPWINTGLAPFIQWVLLPPLIAGITGRLVREKAISEERKP